MILPNFDLFRPRSLEEALEWLTDRRERNVRVIAGGTDLLVDLRLPVLPSGHRPPLNRPPDGIWEARSFKPERPDALCALWGLAELKGIAREGNRIRVGSMTTITELERSDLVAVHLAALHDGADQLGSALVRHRGTYGGNLCNARPAADTAIPTLALGGKLVLVSTHGERIVEHRDFTVGPGKTLLERDEILKEVIFDLDEWGGEGASIRSNYIKLAQRKSLEISVVGAAAAVGLDGCGRVGRAAIALGAVAPKPILALDAGESLVGEELTQETISRAARLASEFAQPITDHRGSREYRIAMVEVLVRRALNACAESNAAAEATV